MNVTFATVVRLLVLVLTVVVLQLAVVGSTMGTRDEREQLARFLETSGVRPVIDRELPLADARDGFAAMAAGEVVGTVVFRDLAG